MKFGWNNSALNHVRNLLLLEMDEFTWTPCTPSPLWEVHTQMYDNDTWQRNRCIRAYPHLIQSNIIPLEQYATWRSQSEVDLTLKLAFKNPNHVCSRSLEMTQQQSYRRSSFFTLTIMFSYDNDTRQRTSSYMCVPTSHAIQRNSPGTICNSEVTFWSCFDIAINFRKPQINLLEAIGNESTTFI